MDSRDILLDTFRDNNAQLITANDMREFINAIYDEKVAVNDIVDNLASDDTNKVLSAYQGKVLNADLTLTKVSVADNTAAVALNTQSLAGLTGGITTTFDTGREIVTVTNGIITNIIPSVS